MQKNFIIPVPPYPSEVMVSVQQSKEELIKSIRKWEMTELQKDRFLEIVNGCDVTGTIGICHHLLDTGFIIIRIFGPVKTPESRGCLAHEIFHAVEDIADHCGFQHCSKSSENWAYLISYLTEKIYERL